MTGGRLEGYGQRRQVEGGVVMGLGGTETLGTKADVGYLNLCLVSRDAFCTALNDVVDTSRSLTVYDGQLLTSF
jgi:hypothetical protein